MLIFVLGEDRFSNTFELGILNEHLKILDSITSMQCLSTTAFLNPALRAVIAKLRLSIII